MSSRGSGRVGPGASHTRVRAGCVLTLPPDRGGVEVPSTSVSWGLTGFASSLAGRAPATRRAYLSRHLGVCRMGRAWRGRGPGSRGPRPCCGDTSPTSPPGATRGRRCRARRRRCGATSPGSLAPASSRSIPPAASVPRRASPGCPGCSTGQRSPPSSTSPRQEAAPTPTSLAGACAATGPCRARTSLRLWPASGRALRPRRR